MIEEIIFHPIGYIRSEFKDKNNMPKNSSNDFEGILEVDSKYEEGMCDMKVGEKYLVLFHFNQTEGYDLKVPFKGNGPITGLFSTHAPARPNPIGISTITVKEINKNKIKFTGVDMLDKTPVLDIKDAI